MEAPALKRKQRSSSSPDSASDPGEQLLKIIQAQARISCRACGGGGHNSQRCSYLLRVGRIVRGAGLNIGWRALLAKMATRKSLLKGHS